MPGKHAVKSPSSSHRWGSLNACTASIRAQYGKPDNAMDITRIGSTGHGIVDECVSDHIDGGLMGLEPHDFVGRTMVFYDDHTVAWKDQIHDTGGKPQHFVTVDEKLADQCETHIQFVLERQRLTGGKLYVESRVPIDHITGEEGAEGSTDTALVYGTTCEICDLKLGGREVKAYEVVVPAHVDILGQQIAEVVEPNSQLAMYASGTMRKLQEEEGYVFTDVVLTISQPSIGKVSQWSGTVAEMNVVIDRLRKRSIECDTDPVFRPSPDTCLYCKASGDCEAQTEAVFEIATIGFDDVAPRPKTVLTLGDRFNAIPMISDWIKATESRTRQALENNEPVVRSDGIAYKLVDGKASAREWDNEAEVEATVEKMRLKKEQTHSKPKLLSPAQMEHLWKEKKDRRGNVTRAAALGPTQAKRLQEHITQGQNAPVIVLETDPRPARAKATDGFEDVPVAGDMPNADLF